MSDNDFERRPRSLNPGRPSNSDSRRPYRRDEAGSGQRGDDRGASRRRDEGERSTGRGGFSRGTRPQDGNERRSYGDRDERRGGFSRQDRPQGTGERRPYGDRDERRGGFSRQDRPQGTGERRPYGDRDERRGGFSRQDRPQGTGERRSYGDRDERRGGFSRQDRPQGTDDRRSYGDRSSRPASSRDGGRSARLGGPRRDDRRDDRRARRDEVEAPKEWRPGLKPREDEPDTPRDVDLKALPRQVKAELRGLPSDLADVVGAHLLAAGSLIEEDPALAYRHAEAARRRASRLPIIREATAETAYAAGEYAVALNEFRALRRMSGDDAYLHVMADCERALGRPDDALKLIREAQRGNPDDEQAVELRLVEAGCREDMGQRAEAMRLLKVAIEDFVDGPPVAQARLRFAYAEALLRRGKEEQARAWLETAVRLDPDDESGAGERLAELDGIVLDLDFDDEEDETDPMGASEDADGDILPEDPADAARPQQQRAEEAEQA